MFSRPYSKREWGFKHAGRFRALAPRIRRALGAELGVLAFVARDLIVAVCIGERSG